MYYTYLWLRTSGTPYYVGKGSGNRAFISHAHGVHCPASISRILLQQFPCEQDAFEAEKFLIAYYGRQDLGTGCLRNRTGGWDDPPSQLGVKRSEETRRKLRESHKGIAQSALTIEKRRIANAGFKHSESSIENMKAIHNTPEVRAKKSKALKGVPWTPARRAASLRPSSSL